MKNEGGCDRVSTWLVDTEEKIMYTECKISKLSLEAWRRRRTVSETYGCSLWLGAQVWFRQRQLPFYLFYIADDNDLHQAAWCGCNTQISVVEENAKNIDGQTGHPHWGLPWISSITPQKEEIVPGFADNRLSPSISRFFTHPIEVLTAP